jgi:hypothetical protein
MPTILEYVPVLLSALLGNHSDFIYYFKIMLYICDQQDQLWNI